MPHVHIGAVEFLTTAAYVIIFTLLWRALSAWTAARNPTLGKAMAGVYS